MESRRSTPWPGASNLVVPLIRIHADTFAARVLGMIFGTHSLVVAKGYPTEYAEPLEKYLNFKAVYQWKAYQFAKNWMNTGLKSGTSICRASWVEDKSISIMPGEDGASYSEEEVIHYLGPRYSITPFEDHFVYPVTAVNAEEVRIWFTRLRFLAEEVRDNCESGRWDWPWETDERGEKKGLKGLLRIPNDAKRTSEQESAGVRDALLEELHVIECQLRYPIYNNGKLYDITALYCPDLNDFIDLYFNPFPRNMRTHHEYRPAMRDGIWYGESWAEILETFQEEVSTIHNDRRNNSYLANTPMFKKKNGSMQPSVSSRWYPGKVWGVDAMDDLEIILLGRNYSDMLGEENFTMQLAERVTGMNAAMQGQSQGAMGKRGVYSSQGTMAILSESNDRQGIAIKDFRESMSAALKTGFVLQSKFGANDGSLEYFPKEDREAIQAALEYAKQSEERLHLCPFDIRTSTARMNQEVERQNLMQMMGTLQQYYGVVQQYGQMLLDPNLNPGLRVLVNDIVVGHKKMAKRLLRAFDEIDPEGMLPDVAAAIESVIPGGSRGSEVGDEPNSGAGGEATAPLSRSGLEGILALPGGSPQGPGGYPA